MKKLLFIAILIACYMFVKNEEILAAPQPGDCSFLNKTTITTNPEFFYVNANNSIQVQVAADLTTGNQYRMFLKTPGGLEINIQCDNYVCSPIVTAGDPNLGPQVAMSIQSDGVNLLSQIGTYNLRMWNITTGEKCTLYQDIQVLAVPPTCTFTFTPNSCVDDTKKITVKATNVTVDGILYSGQATVCEPSLAGQTCSYDAGGKAKDVTFSNGEATAELGPFPLGTTLKPRIKTLSWNCDSTTQMQITNDPSQCLPGGPGSPSVSDPPEAFNPCTKLDASGKDQCLTCQNAGGAYTAIGCIPLDPSAFTGSLVRVLFTLAGGAGFLLIIYGAFLCLTSRGDPQKAQACKETITAAIVGILMVIFSLFIVQVLFRYTGGIFPDIIPAELFV